MTDRVHSVLVVFDKDIRDDDLEHLIELFRWLKGVVAVEPNVSDVASMMAEERARHEFTEKIWGALR